MTPRMCIWYGLLVAYFTDDCVLAHRANEQLVLVTKSHGAGGDLGAAVGIHLRDVIGGDSLLVNFDIEDL